MSDLTVGKPQDPREHVEAAVVDAYADLADQVDRARDNAGGESWSHEVLAMAHAMREWAVAQPARWGLLYGTPVPDAHAAAERAGPIGTRIVASFLDAVAAGITTGDIVLVDSHAPQPTSSDFRRLRDEYAFPGDDHVVGKCFLLFAGVVGAISLEVFGKYGTDTLGDAGTVFDTQVRLLVDVLSSN